MKFLRFFVAAILFVMSGNVMAQSQKELNQLMRERGEFYFTLKVEKPAEVQAISQICSVDGFDGHTVVAYANQQEYDRLLKAGYQPELQTPPSLREEAKMWDGNRATYAWDSYPTYSQYQSMMEAYPASVVSGRTCTLITLGTLSSGRKIMGVRINNGSPEGKPKFLYSSTIHGDETTGWILMLRLIDELCTSTDSRIVNLVDNLDIFIFPNTNPDGTYYGGNNTVTGARRANANGIDMNRNYPDPHSSAHPDGNAYQTETQWFMQLAEDYPFVMAANYHGGSELVNYPWDNTYTRHADDAWWQYVSREYANLAHAVSANYMTDENNGITNGADWYTIGGGRQDYMNGYRQCREVTVECSTTKNPSATQLPSFWNYNHNAMLTYMEECLNGVHGFVYDANTEQPLDGVTITVQDHDDEYSIVSTHEAGDFHRPIKGGTYTFTFAKQGYYSQSVQVTVADGQRVNLEINLQPNLNLTADFTASTTNVSLGQSISFTDTSEGMTSSWSWTFEGATPSTSTAQNPTVTYNTPGDYDVTLIVTGPTGNIDTITKENYIHVAESILMQNGSVTTCSGIFYDSGGPDTNYGNNLTYTMTFYPGTEGAMVCVNFTQFNTESGYDYLYVYNGTSIDATLIGQYDGTTSPGTVMATNEAGALTFKFTSDSGVNAAGWVATVSCFQTDVPVNITVSANPSNGGTVSGGGEFTFGETCTVTATPKTGYTFMGWMENETVVSQNPEYSFTAISDRDLVANFAHMTTIEIGTSETTNTFLPSYSYYKQALTQQIYTAEEIGTAGTIVSIAFYNEATTTRTRTYDFYLKATNKSSFSSKTDWITVVASDKVFSGSVDMTAGTWTTILFDTPFEYDGTSNLVLVADDNTGRYDSSPYMACSVFNTTTSQAIYYWDDNTNFNPLSPPTSSGSSSWSDSPNDVLSVKNHILLGIETPTEEEQTVSLAQGWNWWSTNLDITLEELQAALEAAGITPPITIKSQNDGSSTFNGTLWRGQLTSLDPNQMYKIQTSSGCEITLTGTPIVPAEHPITITQGNNWIVYPLDEIHTVNEVFGAFAAVGDAVKSANGSAVYAGNGNWRGKLGNLIPGQGYVYYSTTAEDRTFTFESTK